MARLLAYGSLMWDNALARYEGETVRVEGHDRAFVGTDIRLFGTPEHPCPRVGLVPGEGGCRAILFEVPFRDRRYLYRNLKQREGRPLGTVRVRDASDASLRARAFLPARHERAWAGLDEVVEALRHAQGLVGTGAEYIRTLVHAMELRGIEDRLILDVWDRVKDWTAGRGSPAGAA